MSKNLQKKLNIKTFVGGKDPIHIVEDFISGLGFNPSDCLKESLPDVHRWMLPVQSELHLELLLENIKTPDETCIYMGVNIAAVPLKKTQEFLVTALELADGLVGAKISLVGHFIVMSTVLKMDGLEHEDLLNSYELIFEQVNWFQETLAISLGLSEED